jgi:hypothetical protein
MFCQRFSQQCGTNPNFPAFMVFMDEAQFKRDGIQNFHNQHLWADENHMQFFHHITNSGSPSTSGPVFGIWTPCTSRQAYRAGLQSFLGKQHV